VSDWSGEDLRRRALEALGEHADERAREALAHADVAVAVGVTSWDGSAGRMEAHGVTLGVDARTLGALRGVPALTDALCAAVAAAIATRPGQTLHDLHARWSPGRASAAGYRDAPPASPEVPLEEALADYLAGAGEQAVARALGGAAVDASVTGEISLRLAPASHERLRDDPHASAMLTAALRDLVGDAKLRVRLR
jgi:hypothetical protein